MLSHHEKITMSLTEISSAIKNDLKNTVPDCKFSVRQPHTGKIIVSLMKAPYLPSLSDERQVNEYYIKDSKHLTLYGKALFLIVRDIVNHYNFDESDPMIDYFHCNFYVSLEIGQWNKKFQLN